MTEVDVIVVGAGLSGIDAAWHLRHTLPHKTFTILEARDAIGGTWDLFRFPGIRSDSDIQTYGFEFRAVDRHGPVADGASILDYLARTVDENDLRDRIRFGHRVVRISWSSEESRWTVEAERADTGERVVLRSSWVFATTGYFRYDRGYQPEFPGVERFNGDARASAGVAGGPRRRRQAHRRDRQRCDRRHVGARALAERGAHVTMLQRSPSYFISLPEQDPIANFMQRHLSPARAYAWTRVKNERTQALFYRLSRTRPALVKRLLLRDVARRLPDGYDVARHFTPTYDPWDQRVCLTPGGDLFRAISSGRATVVTDTIDTFTEHGIRLSSGEELDADIVVSATGLDLLALGAMDIEVDGQPMPAGERGWSTRASCSPTCRTSRSCSGTRTRPGR